MFAIKTGGGQGAKALISVLLAASLCGTYACASQATKANSTTAASASSEVAQQQAMSDSEIVDTVVDNFMLLTAVPRPSHHEEKISAYLMNWAKEQGFSLDGVHTMSADREGLVESSSNLGILKLDEDGLSALAFVRSSNGAKQTEIVESHKALAKEAGCEVEVTHTADAWPYDPNSKLTELAKQVYQQLNGEEIEVAAVHAGVECGTFKSMKADLDMISIGPDLENVHTPNEVLYLKSIPKTWRLLEGILAEA